MSPSSSSSPPCENHFKEGLCRDSIISGGYSAEMPVRVWNATTSPSLCMVYFRKAINLSAKKKKKNLIAQFLRKCVQFYYGIPENSSCPKQLKTRQCAEKPKRVCFQRGANRDKGSLDVLLLRHHKTGARGPQSCGRLCP